MMDWDNVPSLMASTAVTRALEASFRRIDTNYLARPVNIDGSKGRKLRRRINLLCVYLKSPDRYPPTSSMILRTNLVVRTRSRSEIHSSWV